LQLDLLFSLPCFCRQLSFLEFIQEVLLFQTFVRVLPDIDHNGANVNGKVKGDTDDHRPSHHVARWFVKDEVCEAHQMVVRNSDEGLVEELEVQCLLLDVGFADANVDHKECHAQVHEEQLEVAVLLQVDEHEGQQQHAVQVDQGFSHRILPPSLEV